MTGAASILLATPSEASASGLENLLSADLQLFDNLLSNAALASYLLAYDTANTEHFETLRRADLSVMMLAEGDDDKKKKPAKPKKWRVKKYEPNEKDESAAEITDGENAPFGLRFDVPPQEAIDFFKRKQLLPPEKFYELDGQAKAGAFSVSRVYKMDVIAGFQNELVDAMQTGRTTDQVIKRLRKIVDGAGHKELSTNHLETVVRTTMQMAYGVGRRMAQEEVKDLLPVWEYSAVGDDRTRPTHMALDGLQYPADHVFWSKYYPPWDFRCRCTVIPVLDYRKGYDRGRPNQRTVIDFDAEGLPTGANVDGTPMNFKAVNFSGVPSQASLAAVLQRGAAASLEARVVEKPVSLSTPDQARSFGEKEFPNYGKSLTQEEANSISHYTSTAYEPINKYLRGKDVDFESYSEREIIGHIRHLDAAIEKGILTKDLTVYRAFGWHKRFQKGDFHRDEGFVSSTMVRKLAEGWPLASAREKGLIPTVFEFVIPRGTRVSYVEQISAVKGEYELLLARGQSFEILSSRKVGDVIYAKARLKR